MPFTHQLKVFSRERQNSPHKLLIVVERVEGGGGDVVGTGGRVAVLEVLVHGEEVHVVHDDVVTVTAGHEEPSVEETGTVKPVRERERVCLHSHTREEERRKGGRRGRGKEEGRGRG